MREKNTAHRGFSLIELLVVIAIIGILAAILFPVFNTAREKTRQTTCMGQLQSIGVALKLTFEDDHKYPAVLSAIPYISDSASASGQSPYTGTGTPLDIDQVLISHRPLMKQRNSVSGKQTFLCPDHYQADSKAVVSAVWPPNVPKSGAVVDSASKPVPFYSYDSYTVGPALDANNQATAPYTYELHYARDWTGVISAADPINQLKYPNPPQSSTVVTWCTWHAAVNHSGMIPVLMLSGNVKAIPANQFTSKGPLKIVP